MSDFKDELKKKLAEDGTLSSADLGTFNKPEPQEESSEPVSDGPVKTQVPSEASDDTFIREASAAGPGEEVAVDAAYHNPDEEGYQFGLQGLDEVEISEEDKNAFLDAVVDDSRFERPFSLFNGRVTGIFRSRTVGESRAIIIELHRQWAKHEYLPASEYSTLMKSAMLRMQLKELNGVQYPEAEEPLIATYNFKAENVKDPAWFKEMDEMCNKMSDAVSAALYEALVYFEKVYWTMVKKAEDQNFWNPEDSI